MKTESVYSIPPGAAAGASSGKGAGRNTVIAVCMALAAVTLTLFLKAGSFQFLNLDDNLYVTNNPHVATGLSLRNIAWAFTTVDYSYWHPVTWLSHMIDVQLFGMTPRGHHLTSVVIHTLAALALLGLMLRLTGVLWKSAFVATLFAIHPMHVESVAWVAERKDVLSALFCFLALYFYAGFIATRKSSRYILTLLAFLLGLMSKPMLVTLPVVMLLLDFWPLERFNCEKGPVATGLPLLREKIPFFVLSLVSGLVTIYGQHQFGAMSDLTILPLSLRIENALVSYVKYVAKTVWPVDLAVLYPFPDSVPLWQAAGSLVLLILASWGAVRARQRFPYLVAGWFWFLVMLVPVIGLTQVGNQAMADRFAYIPGTGLFIMVAWGIPDLASRLPYRDEILATLAVAIIVVSAALTWHQLSYWSDNVTLFRHSLAITEDSELIDGNLGVALIENGDPDGAIRVLSEAVRRYPSFVYARHNLGIAYAEKGDYAAAIREYRTALQMSPDDAKLRYNYGVALAGAGASGEAIGEFLRSLQLQPDDPRTHYNLGRAYAARGDRDAAIREFRTALAIGPDDLDVRINLGVALAGTGNFAAAIGEYRAALRLNGASKYAHNNLGVALVNTGDLDGAVTEFREVLRAHPGDLDAHSNLGVVYARKGDRDGAIREFSEALRISPGDGYARNNLNRVLGGKGDAGGSGRTTRNNP